MMMKSKIPLPNKRPIQSSIPLPTKFGKIQAKKLPSNSNEVFIPKKPVPVKQGLTKPAKGGAENEKTVKRLASSKPTTDSKTLVQLSKNSSKPHMSNRVVLKVKPSTGNNVLKQAKPAPIRPKKVALQSKFVAGKENQPKRFSSFKPQNSKNTFLPSKPSKIINEAKKSTKTLKENLNTKSSLNEKEKIDAVPPIGQTNVIATSCVEDSEFKDSRFYKQLILDQRELSPGILKMCSDSKFSSEQSQPKFSLRVQSADELVAEIKRVSSKYTRLNGKLVRLSPAMIKHKEMSAEDFLDDVKRNSARFRQRKGNLFLSPCSFPQNSPVQRMPQNIVTVKENVDVNIIDEVRRLSEFRSQSLRNVDSFMASRRWTCNVTNKPSIANMSTSEIAAELLRLSEIRRESGAQLAKKGILDNQYSVEKLNPHQRALRNIYSLSAKKPDKVKKKVTFLIPSKGSPDSIAPTKTEGKLSDIPEGSSRNCTPELDLSSKVKTNPYSGESDKDSEDTSAITTPELNLPTLKLNFGTTPPKEVESTQPSVESYKVDESCCNNSSDSQTMSSTVVGNVSNPDTNQCFQNSNLNNFKSHFLSSKFSSLEISDSIVCDNTKDNISFENYLTSKDNKYDEFSELKPTECLFQSAHKLTVPQAANETEKFCVNTERKIYTPHPALHKSNLPSSVSPSFLSGKFTTLNSCAPICTPLVLRNMALSPEVDLGCVRQKLDFNEKSNICMERRESQIIIQTIPTAQKMNDYLCDQECIILSSQCVEEEIFLRNLRNPIAATLSNGDEMHFLPVSSP